MIGVYVGGMLAQHADVTLIGRDSMLDRRWAMGFG
jgi:ketopantoate reductase